jgi:Protein of unknown function with PCYCGC motif
MSSARSFAASLLLAGLVTACGGSPEPAATPPAQPAPATAPVAEQQQAPAVFGIGNDVVVAPDITDADIPPLPVTPFPAARPAEIVRAVYVFAAKHPEVLNQVPCFCGCENRGHRHNDDCFVAARDAKGRPTSWEPHGVG